MKPISYKRHRFPPDVIRHAVWLYFRFTLSLRDVEALLAERGIEVSYEAIRCWAQKFGVQFARNLRRSRPKPTGRWHLDEMAVRIGGRRMFLWRAVDDEGEVLDLLVQRRRNKRAAVRLLRKLLKSQGIHPEAIVANKLGSYAGAKAVGLSDRLGAGRPSAEQSGGELAPADPPARAQAAEVQEPGISPAFALDPRRGLQHVQPPAPGPRGVGERDQSGVITERCCRTRSTLAR
jgi:transposase-like protein